MTKKKRRNRGSGTSVATGHVQAPMSAALPALAAFPHDPALPGRAREQWLMADWRSLSQLPTELLYHHPERAQLAALAAAASQQSGDKQAARQHAVQALAWGCDRRLLGQALLAGARQTLGRASFAAGRERQAEAHFERAVPSARLASEVRRHVQMRRDRVAAELRTAISATSARSASSKPGEVQTPRWIVTLAEQCAASPDVHDSVDHAMETLVSTADERLHFMMRMAKHFENAGDTTTASHFLQYARHSLPDADASLRDELARRLVAAGSAESAMDLFVEAALSASQGDTHDVNLAEAVRTAYVQLKTAAHARNEHGHELLRAHLERQFATLQAAAGGRQLTLIEIGTTREEVPGQGSTRKLAELCLRHGMHFVTVDMDPHNGRMARETFARLGANFEAVTTKGEDYLRERPAPIDIVFLDAYDFDHGHHSALRQSRYEKYLGARIDEQACHQMHLECAQSLMEKLWAHGLVCIDDTWLEKQRWTAKGTTAMPFLLSHGFELVEARNRAALLRRKASTADGAT